MLTATQARPPVTVSVCVNIGAAAVFSVLDTMWIGWEKRAVDRSRLNFRASIVYPSFDSRQWHRLLDFHLCNTREPTAYIHTYKDNEGNLKQTFRDISGVRESKNEYETSNLINSSEIKYPNTFDDFIIYASIDMLETNEAESYKEVV